MKLSPEVEPSKVIINITLLIISIIHETLARTVRTKISYQADQDSIARDLPKIVERLPLTIEPMLKETM